MSIEIFPDAEALALHAADVLAMAAQEGAAARGRFAVALSGGETPRALYRMLARQQFSQKVPWRRTHLYWGDERCVPPADPQSNYGMAHDAFIRHVPIAPENVHRMRGEDLPEEAAHEYDAELRRLERRVDELVATIGQLKEENRALRQRQDTLMTERATLLQKNEQVRARVEAMIGRLKAMEHMA